MADRPILFSAPMVRALLEGHKTQTRRIVRPQPYFDPMREHWQWDGAHGHASWSGDRPQAAALLGLREHCPYGRPGDRLWVRETWGLHAYGDETEWLRGPVADAGVLQSWCPAYRADWDAHPEGCYWRSPVTMPRWASRITLEVTGVRVERLQDISEEDARAEGVEPFDTGWHDYTPERPGEPTGACFAEARDSFASLWCSIHGPDSWAANPWVWVIEFRRLEAVAADRETALGGQ